MKGKIVIYQALVRLFGNDNATCVPNGKIGENGCGKFNDFTPHALRSIKQLGVTHIWFTGILEHATRTDYSIYGIARDHPAIVKGEAGSPYAIKDYYNICPDSSNEVTQRMQEFEALVERAHHAGLKVIIDFVPNHVSRIYHSDNLPCHSFDFGQFDQTDSFFRNQNNYYYIQGKALGGSVDWYAGETEPYCEEPARATGNDRFDAEPDVNDWYETVKLNYGINYMTGEKVFSPIPNTWVKMLKILLFWASKGVDGFRCDMVEMVPVEFWEWSIKQVKETYKNILFAAEVYQPSLYQVYIRQGGFDLLYDKVGLYDTLRSVTCRQAPASSITGCWQSVQQIQGNMLNFIENHDEQRVASDFYAGDAFKGIPAATLCATLNSNPVMLYFGQELGERGMDAEGFSGLDGRTTIFDYWSLSSIRRWRNGGKYDGGQLNDKERELQLFYTKLLHICQTEKAIYEGEFFDLTYANRDSSGYNCDTLFSFVRKKDDELIIVSVNFGDTPAHVSLNFPTHLFETFSLPVQNNVTATELLSGSKMNVDLTPQVPIQYTINRFSSIILKIRIKA